MKKTFAIAGVISFVLASAIIYIAIDHNPMEAYCERQSDGGCIPNLANLSGLWATGFVASFVIQAVAMLTIIKIVAMLRKK